VYDRRVKNDELSFGHSGRLYKESYLLYDHQTNSYWVQVTGEAKAGPLKGTSLKFIPSTVTSWQNWKTLYPETEVLPGIGVTGFMGTYRGFDKSEYFGLAVSHLNRAKLYPYKIFEEQPVLNDVFQGKPIVLVISRDQNITTVWGRKVRGKVLTFRAETDSIEDFLMADNETDSRWDPLTGICLTGSYAGIELPAQTNTPILIDRFKDHYPKGEIYIAKQR